MKVMVSPSKRGFTLIELLVVIAIIAILAAILFPVFAQARKKAYQASGTSNARQAALGIVMYTQDYDEKMPRAGWGCQNFTTGNDDKSFSPGDENSCGSTEWQNATYPYVKNAGIYTSPGDATKATFDWGTDMHSDDGNFSLVINDLLSHQLKTDANGYADANNGQSHKADGLSQAALVAPSDCVLLMEGHCGWNKVDNGLTSSAVAADTKIPATGKTCHQDMNSKWCKEQTISGFQTQLFCAHNYTGGGVQDGNGFYMNGSIVAFADGHAKYVKYTDANGNPTLCATLPWPKSIDPQQRNATANNGNSCKDPKNMPGSGNANWN